MALSRVIAVGDGVTKTFVLNFSLGYLSQSDVTARVGTEADGSGNPIYRAMTWNSTTLATISGTAPGVGVPVVFERSVPRDRLLVDYENNDIINDTNLNVSQKQMLMAIHEFLDGRIDAFNQDLDLGGFRARNMAAPVSDTDGANKLYVDTQTRGFLDAPDLVAQATATSVAAIAAAQASAQAIVIGANTAVNNALAVLNASNQLATPADDTVSTVKIQSKAVTLPKIQDIPTGNVLGRSTAGTGSVELLSPAVLRGALNLDWYLFRKDLEFTGQSLVWDFPTDVREFELTIRGMRFAAATSIATLTCGNEGGTSESGAGFYYSQNMQVLNAVSQVAGASTSTPSSFAGAPSAFPRRILTKGLLGTAESVWSIDSDVQYRDNSGSVAGKQYAYRTVVGRKPKLFFNADAALLAGDFIMRVRD